MLTKLKVRNFKRFDEIEIELGKAVVMIGPNNSGKTTALQALALWDIGVKRWNEKRRGKSSPEQRPRVTVNRRDLVAIPVPSANLLWRDMHVRDTERIEKEGKASTKTQNVRVEITVDGVSNDAAWSCGLEFDYANEESFYCRPLRIGDGPERMPVPAEAAEVQATFLPPMSGLSDREFMKQPGEIGVLIGQGQTAQVIRNLCFRVALDHGGRWNDLVAHIHSLFGVTIASPQFIAERGEITMTYKDQQNNTLDLSSSGRGLQQTLLLLAHVYANPGSVLLLDEPDAHLEILRQRQTYNLLVQIAEQQKAQVIAASHSEVVLNEAADRDIVVAFVGKPHRIDDRNSQVLKSLRDIGFDQYYQAEERGWVLYVENSTDLAILKAFANVLDHEAQEYLESPFVKYVESNLPQRARDHFSGLKEAKTDLVGIAIFDHIDKELRATGPLTELCWKSREIENYFCTEQVLLKYAKHDDRDLFGLAQRERRAQTMKECIAEITLAYRVLTNKPLPFSSMIKATDDFLDPLFKNYFAKLELPLQLRKSDYHLLARMMDAETINPEVCEKLNAIVTVAKQARPRTE